VGVEKKFGKIGGKGGDGGEIGGDLVEKRGEGRGRPANENAGGVPRE
jgi:hypothetical protein